MFPEFNFDNFLEDIQAEDDFIYNNTSYLYDFKKGDFIYKNGNPIPATKRNALKTWIEKAIRTRIYNYDIYSNIEEDGYLSYREYGSNIIDLVKGKKLPNLVVKAEAQRDIEEVTSQNPYIRRIEDFDIISGSETGKSWVAVISFTVITVFNDADREFLMEVEI